MKKDKKANRTTSSRESTKVVDLYDDLFTMREMPVSEALIDRVFQEAYEAVIVKGTVLKLSQYFRKLGIPWVTVKRWREKFPWVEEKYQELLQGVGDNREVGGLTKKLDAGMVQFSMPMYDPDWKQNVEWRSKLKAENDQQGSVTVVMQPIEKSDLVPDKE